MIICIISALHAFAASGSTPVGDNGVLLLFLLPSFALPNAFLIEAHPTAISDRKCRGL